jgi:hypothetical protein
MPGGPLARGRDPRGGPGIHEEAGPNGGLRFANPPYSILLSSDLRQATGSRTTTGISRSVFCW